MSDNQQLNTGPVVFSEEHMAFPKERQEKMEALERAKQQETAHLPYPPKSALKPNQGQQPRAPMAAPIENAPPEHQRHPGFNQQGVAYGAPPDHPQFQQQQPRQQAPQQPVYQPTQSAAPLGNQPNANQQSVPYDWTANIDPNAVTRSVPSEEDDQQQDPLPGIGQIPVTMPGFDGGTADALSSSVALPSRFAFYPFKDLYVQPLRAKHIAKLQRAHSEGSLLPMVEAVSSVIHTTTPGVQATAFDLTLPDFYFVLYWLRLHSFTKSNYIHTTVCNNEDHHQRVYDFEHLQKYMEQVQQGEMTAEEFQVKQAKALPKESLKIEQIIRNTNMRVVELTAIPDPEVFHFTDTSAMFLRPPTMRDTIEFTEHPKFRNKNTRAEFTYLAELAIHVQHRQLLLNLDARLGIVEEATTAQITMINDFKDLLADYGVQEEITVQCKGCGAKRKSMLSLDAHSFLSAR